MKNNQQQILCEIKSLMASIKTQFEELENKIAEYEQNADVQNLSEDLPVEDFAREPIPEECVETIGNDALEEFDHKTVEGVADDPVLVVDDEVMDIELEVSDDLPFYDDTPVADSQPEIACEETEDLPEDVKEHESEPESEQESEPVQELPETKTDSIPVIDAMFAKQQWRTDISGSPVKDIRSAISLNDRILFINYLFGEDPMAFQQMLTQLNAMGSFDEAAAHVIAAHPEWDLESDTVYRFMMALRRRHQ